MRRAAMGIAVGWLGGPAAAAAAVLDVPGVFATVGAAITAAAPGDTIEVAEGVYAPSTTGETFPLTITKDGLVLRGAGMGLSVLDAEGTTRVLTWSAASGGQVSGFTIRGGTADQGGGLRIDNGDPEIDHNLFTGNAARIRGAGIVVLKQTAPATTPWIHHNIVWENFDNDLSDPQDPHGVNYAGQAFGVFEHNLVGRTDGNGLLTGDPSRPVVRHSLFLENGAPGPPPRGRGICWLSNAPAIIVHNLFHANQLAAVLWPAAGTNFSGAGANDVSPTDDVYGNLDGDPLLVDPDGGDFHLSAGSPAIDAGDPSLPPDPDGTVADLGPFWFDQSAVGAPVTRGGAALRLVIAPNPFRERAAIRFELPRASPVEVRIVDVAGRTVRRLAAGQRPAGPHEVAWDGRDDRGRAAASGVYLAVLRSEDGVRSRPLVLLD